MNGIKKNLNVNKYKEVSAIEMLYWKGVGIHHSLILVKFPK
jgi:hypothetical protein